MVGFATVAGAGDFGFPVCLFVVKSTGCSSTLGNGRPGFGGFGEIGNEAAWGDRDMTALRSLSLCHAETT